MYQPRQFPTFVYPTETNVEKLEETHSKGEHNNNSSKQTKIAPAMISTQSSEGTTLLETYDNHVSSSTLEKLCTDACIDAFAEIKKANMLLQQQNQELEKLLANKN